MVGEKWTLASGFSAAGRAGISFAKLRGRLEAHLDAVKRGHAPSGANGVDPATLQRIKALGYID